MLYTGKEAKSRVLFFDGSEEDHVIFVDGGMAMAGDPTAFVLRNGRRVWVRRTSGPWVEADVAVRAA